MGSNECIMSFPTRVIALTADPNAPDEIYAALEFAGVIRSLMAETIGKILLDHSRLVKIP
ncbi:MAG: hypothetical protein CM1200mP15_15270 [Dehalococcoidia bacterium]|nr:MAG: hypothetical protein CM1200mP15_15270 [Dehalococcoidia bacterium]